MYAKDFYLTNCPKYFHQTGVVRIPKNEDDANKFIEYEKYNNTTYEKYGKDKLKSLGINTNFDSFYFPDAGDCDAPLVCNSLLKHTEIMVAKVLHIEQQGGLCKVLTKDCSLLSKNIILATGYESNLADLRYMGIRGTWGTRGDFSSKLDLNVSMHQSMSVGANINGIIKLGATHEKMINSVVPCSQKQALSLQDNASNLIDISDLKLKEIYCGMRAGSKDYFPLVGRVIDVPYMLENYPTITRGAKPKLKYTDNIYTLNGLGGRGFVFAPLMAKILSEHILNAKEIDKIVNPDRLFLKWCRKLIK